VWPTVVGPFFPDMARLRLLVGGAVRLRGSCGRISESTVEGVSGVWAGPGRNLKLKSKVRVQGLGEQEGAVWARNPFRIVCFNCLGLLAGPSRQFCQVGFRRFVAGDFRGLPVLPFACCAAQELLAMRADTNLLSSSGRSAFQMAQLSGSHVIQDLLSAHTAALRVRSPRDDADS
jgi:hypothetical protein